MKHARRMPRQRLTSAVALTLAVGTVTSTATAAASPVTETVVPDVAQDNASATVSIEPGSEIVSAGTTGFLTTDADADVRWTRYADGTSTVLGRDSSQFTETQWHGAVSDTVVVPQPFLPTFGARVLDVSDMATGAAPVRVDLRHVAGGARYLGAVGSTLIARSDPTPNWQQIHLVAKGSGASYRTVTGLPDDAWNITLDAATEEAVLLRYSTGSGDTWHVSVVDLATAAVTETHTVGFDGSPLTAALSSTHLAWFDPTLTSGTMVLNIAERGGQVRRVTTSQMYAPVVGLADGWVTYGNRTAIHQGHPDRPMALTAVPVAGGPSVRLLDHVTSLAPTPGGGLLAMGGTLDEGEGVYRIITGADTAPSTQLVASTGQPTKLAFLGHSVPAVVDLDQNRGQAELAWRLSRLNVHLTMTLRHNRTGLTSQTYDTPYNETTPLAQEVGGTWNGTLNDNGRSVAAPNGDYTWQIHATPDNGIGPALTVTGTFKVKRTPGPHDYTDNTSPDFLARDSSGRLWREDTSYDLLNKHHGEGRRKLLGSGWQIYNRIEAAGNIAGGPAGDLVARDKAGVLWLYQGRGDGTFTTRVKVGGGWQGYQHLTAGSDVTGDGRADLVATDTAGALWLHRGTGNAGAPFAARKKVGQSGWQTFNQITATGNIAGGPAGDLVARDKAGVLWLYQGRGDGTFTTRVKIGGGWSPYTHIVGAGDANRDGRPDLYVWAPYGEIYIYEGTGNAAGPFLGRKGMSSLFDSWQSYNHIV
ncbi:FG-GAP repeat domain-containing protein [Streptomyces sp. NPDC015127]|uniref:FG-GAP repeat domain-containing protein n=1 Tax=Streptomyces sp. NPDC015127 TaxID=3364939 RepID=UPI00370138A3